MAVSNQKRKIWRQHEVPATTHHQEGLHRSAEDPRHLGVTLPLHRVSHLPQHLIQVPNIIKTFFLILDQCFWKNNAIYF